MTVEIPWRVVLFVAVECACVVTGAVVGIGVALVKMRGERRGD